jgi:hypothetical protein
VLFKIVLYDMSFIVCVSSFVVLMTLYTILQNNGGTDTKPMGKTEPQFLSDPMSDKKKFSPALVIVTCVGF